MRAVILWLVGLAMVVNGGVMLVVPATWYALVPGVAGTGPLNAHFVRDIGGAYLVAGVVFSGSCATGGHEPRRSRPQAFC